MKFVYNFDVRDEDCDTTKINKFRNADFEKKFLKTGINMPRKSIVFTLLLILSNLSIIPSFAQYNSFDWNEICKKIEYLLFQSCEVYVTFNGQLTLEGERAMGCIRNGLLIGGGFLYYGLPWQLIVPGLDILSEMTGCDNIVKLNLLSGLPNKDELVTDLQSMLK